MNTTENPQLYAIVFTAFMVLAFLVLPIYSLFDLFKREFPKGGNQKILIILLIIFFPFIGSLIYLIGLKKDFPLKHSRS